MKVERDVSKIMDGCLIFGKVKKTCMAVIDRKIHISVPIGLGGDLRHVHSGCYTSLVPGFGKCRITPVQVDHTESANVIDARINPVSRKFRRKLSRLTTGSFEPNRVRIRLNINPWMSWGHR